MKRITSICLTFFMVLGIFAGTASAAAEYTEPVAPYAALLMDADSQQVLFQQHMDDVVEPASTTKILTCILALEKSSPEDEVTITENAAGATGSSLKLVTNEKVKMKDLLNGMMMVSGNDAAIAVAEHIGGSISGFADMMNAKAQEIGMTNSHFVTPHGMHTDEGDHHSTAHDMAILTLYALKNPQFVDIVKQSSYTMPADNKKGETNVPNTNKLLLSEDTYYYPNATGVKTGSTPAAGGCLVASASKDGMNLICLIYKDETSDESDRWKVAKNLFEWGFQNKKTIDVASLLDSAEPVQVQVENYSAEDTGKGLLEFKKPDAGTAFVTLEKATAEGLQNGTDSLVATPTYNAEPLQAPIEKDAVLGTVTYTSKATGEQVYSCDLIASREVAEAGTTSGETAVTTLPPTQPIKDPGQGSGSVWYWLIIPVLLIGFLVFRLVTTRRSKRFKKRKPHYSYRIK